MKNPFNILGSSKYSIDEFSYVTSFLSGVLKGDEAISKLEDIFANYVEEDFAIAVNSGTSGLHAALLALDLKKGDEIILPAIAVIMDAFVVLQSNATPVFADVDPFTFNISPSEVEKLVTKKTKAIIAIDWEGNPSDLFSLRKIADKSSLKLISDCARSLKSTINGKPTNNYSDISVYSFESKKHLTTGGEGGMIVTSNPLLAEKARKFSGLGYSHLTSKAGKANLSEEIYQNPNYDRFSEIGYNYRMAPVNAAIGLGQLRRASRIRKRRMFCGQSYSEIVNKANKDWIIPQMILEGHVNTFYTYSFFLDEHKGPLWKSFYEFYKHFGGTGFYGCVKIPYQEKALLLRPELYKKPYCPNAEKIQRGMICLKTNMRNNFELKRELNALRKTLEHFK